MKKYDMNAPWPSAKPRGPKRRMYTATIITATNTASAITRCGASNVPPATDAAAGPSMSRVVTRRRPRSGSFTDRLLIIPSIAAKITTVTGCPMSARTPDMTTVASAIDAVATLASCNRPRPGSTPVNLVRSSASHAFHRTDAVSHATTTEELT